MSYAQLNTNMLKHASAHILGERESKHTLKHAVHDKSHPMSTNDAKNSCEQIVPPESSVKLSNRIN